MDRRNIFLFAVVAVVVIFVAFLTIGNTAQDNRPLRERVYSLHSFLSKDIDDALMDCTGDIYSCLARNLPEDFPKETIRIFTLGGEEVNVTVYKTLTGAVYARQYFLERNFPVALVFFRARTGEDLRFLFADLNVSIEYINPDPETLCAVLFNDGGDPRYGELLYYGCEWRTSVEELTKYIESNIQEIPKGKDLACGPMSIILLKDGTKKFRCVEGEKRWEYS